MKSNHKKEIRPRYGLFGIAASVYIGGVILFSGWNYYQQRESMFTQLDMELIHATYAAEQILDRVYLSIAVETKDPYDPGYVGGKQNLTQFLTDCDFLLMGAVGFSKDMSWDLITASSTEWLGHSEANSTDATFTRYCPLNRSLLRTPSEKFVEMRSITIPFAGECRVALRYHKISNDSGYVMMVAQSMADMNQHLKSLLIRSTGIALLLIIMVLPLVLIYNRTHTASLTTMAALNRQLKLDFEKLKIREGELNDAINDLRRFNKLAIDREERIIELKGEVNQLLAKLDQEKRYTVESVD